MTPRILIAEDDTMLAHIARKVLEGDGYQVNIVYDGPSALEMISTWEPDLVMLDIMMPGIDGFEVCRQMRETESGAKIPVILVTARSSIEDKKRGFEVGADEYITKPYENAELLLRVKSLLRRAETIKPGKEKKAGQIIATFSLRGGSGCSSLATNTAVGLASLWQTPTALIDLSVPVGACDLLLNLRPNYRMDNLVNEDLSIVDAELLDSYMESHPSGVKLLAGITNPVQAELLKDVHAVSVLEYARDTFRYVVVDTPHNFLGPSLTVLEQADTILMPVTPDIHSVRVTATALKIFNQLGFEQEKVHLVVNWTFAKNGLDVDRIEKSLGLDVGQVFLHDGLWGDAINLGKPMILRTDNSPTLTQFEELVWDLSTEEDRKRVPNGPDNLWRNARQQARSGASTKAQKELGESEEEADDAPALVSGATKQTEKKKKKRRQWLIWVLAAILTVSFVATIIAVLSLGPDGVATLVDQPADEDSESAEQPSVDISGPLLRTDYFSDPNSGWEQRAGTIRLVYEDGRYRISNSRTDNMYVAMSPYYGPHTDFLVETDAIIESGDAGSSYGLVFRYQDSENFYAFGINGDGQYALWVFEDGVQRSLHDDSGDWADSDAVQPDDTNRLTITADGAELTGLINGEEVFTVEDETHASGEVGLYVVSGETATDVYFDVFTLRAESLEATPSASD